MNKINVLLVDDHLVVREGLRTILSSEPGFNVVGEASSGEEALDKVGELRPHIVLMDISMPGMGGIEATRLIKKEHPTIAVVILTMYDSEVYVLEAIRCGAAGYLTKDASRELLFHALRTVLDGGTLVRSGLLRQAIQGLLRHPPSGAEPREGESALLSRLTQREVEILRLLSQGRQNKAIASELNLAEVTVKKHVQNIIGKLGVSDRTHAAVAAVRLGLI